MNESNYDGYMVVEDSYDLITHETRRVTVDTCNTYEEADYLATKEFRLHCEYYLDPHVWWHLWETHDEERKIRYGNSRRPLYEDTFRVFKYKLIEI